MGCFSLLRFFLHLGFLFSASPPCSCCFLVRFSIESFCLSTFPSSLFHLLFVFFAVLLMAHTRITPNPPASFRNPPPKTRRIPSSGNPSSSRNPPRDPSVPSSWAERPAPSRPDQPRPTPLHKPVPLHVPPLTTNYYTPGPLQPCWVRPPLSTLKQMFFVWREETRPTFPLVRNMMTRWPFALVFLGSLSVLTMRGTTVTPFASSTQPYSRRSSSDSPSLALRGSF